MPNYILNILNSYFYVFNFTRIVVILYSKIESKKKIIQQDTFAKAIEHFHLKLFPNKISFTDFLPRIHDINYSKYAKGQNGPHNHIRLLQNYIEKSSTPLVHRFQSF